MSQHSVPEQVACIKNSYFYILSRLGITQNAKLLENAQRAIQKLTQKSAALLPHTIKDPSGQLAMTQNTQPSIESLKSTKIVNFKD